MGTKHTPGPWRILPPQPQMSSLRIFAGSEFLGCVGNSDHAPDQTDANARLIAAAPDLLEALNQIINNSRVFCAESMDADDGAVYQARAAIRKATNGN